MDKSDKRICTIKEHERRKEVVEEKRLEKDQRGISIWTGRKTDGRHLGRKSIHRLKRSMRIIM